MTKQIDGDRRDNGTSLSAYPCNHFYLYEALVERNRPTLFRQAR